MIFVRSETLEFVIVLLFSRFRLVIFVRNKTLESVIILFESRLRLVIFVRSETLESVITQFLPMSRVVIFVNLFRTVSVNFDRYDFKLIYVAKLNTKCRNVVLTAAHDNISRVDSYKMIIFKISFGSHGSHGNGNSNFR